MSVGKSLQQLFVFLILNGMAKTKFAIVAFLYCGEIVRNSIDSMGGKWGKGTWSKLHYHHNRDYHYHH